MQRTLSNSVPLGEHPTVLENARFQWDDLRVFLTVSRALSFRAAAETLGLSTNKVRAQVERLEAALGGRLFARHPTGLTPTNTAVALLETAHRMESLARDVRRGKGTLAPAESGRLRITVTEGLGSFWLVPRLVRFQRAHPKIILEVNCTFRQPDVARIETDIAIQLGPPTTDNIVAVRLGYMHVMPFASASYLRTYGTPATLAEVVNHKIVEQLSPQLDTAAVDRLFPGKDREGFVAMATNTSTAHLWAVAAGCGIGMLPTYLYALGLNLKPLDLGLAVSHEIFLSYSPAAKRDRKIALAVDFIRRAFDKSLFPWFAPRFANPRDLPPVDPTLLQENRFASLFMSA